MKKEDKNKKYNSKGLSKHLSLKRLKENPAFILSIIYSMAYILISFYLFSIDFQISATYQILYFFGFALFLIAIYITFIGIIFETMNEEDEWWNEE